MLFRCCCAQLITMEFQKLSEENLPEPNKLVWIKRNKGSIYLGYRDDKPIATNEDASKDCFWYGNPTHSMLMADERQLRFRYNFSDVTVDSWAELDVP